MSAVSGGSGGQCPYNCCGSNDSSQSPDLSPKEEEVVQKIRKEAEKALGSALGCCSVCGCHGDSCPVNRPVGIKPKDENAWKKALETATSKLRDLAKGGNNNPGNPNAYDWHPGDKPFSSNNEDEEKNSGNPNAYNG